MVKVLICGSVCGQFSTLIEKVQALQSSQHGPFDLLFCTGIFFANTNEIDNFNNNFTIPIKTYVLQSFDEVETIPENINFLSGSNMITVDNLTIAYCCNISMDGCEADNLKNFKKFASAPGYRGCDLFFTLDWPKDMHQFLTPE